MSYPDPSKVTYPENRWKLEEVIFDGGENQWSAALGEFDKKDILAIRWNGHKTEPNGYPKGLHGRPCWFVVPDELKDIIQAAIELLKKSTENIK